MQCGLCSKELQGSVPAQREGPHTKLQHPGRAFQKERGFTW